MNSYLSKLFFIVEKDSKNLSTIPNDVKLIIHVIGKLETYFLFKKNQFPL